MINAKDKLIPFPKKLEQNEGSITFNGVAVVGAGAETPVYYTAVSLLEEMGAGEFACNISISSVLDGRKEAYVLDITKDKISIVANDDAGIFYAAQTIKNLLEKEDGKNTLPLVHIEDYPDFYDRGLMLENRYGSDFMTFEDYKKAIDYLAAMKYNQLTVGVYGCWCVQYDMRLSEFLYLPLKSHPELETRRDIRYWSPKNNDFVIREDVLPTMFAQDYFGELIRYAAARNIKIKPLFNSLGHNTLIPRLHPELSAKDENGNLTKHGFCISNDAVYDFMFSIYDEIIERYLAPNGIDAIEIGLDEVYPSAGEDLDDIYGLFDPYCKCDKCRGLERKELMIRYIIRICKHLKEKGMKSVYIYHDMLFEKFDVVNEELKQRFIDEGIYDVVVLDWWSYEKKENLFDKKEINGIFRGIAKPFTGYYHWVVPMEYNTNIKDLCDLAVKYGFEGIESYSSFEYCFDRPFMYQAELSWNTDHRDDVEGFLRRYAANRFPEAPEAAKEMLDKIGSVTANDTVCGDKVNNLMNGIEYYWSTYVTKDQPYPRNFHGTVYSRLLRERELFTEYFERVIKATEEVMPFFSGIDSDIARVWYAIAKHYYTYSVNYMKVLSLYDDYHAEKCDANAVVEGLRDVLARQNDFMATVEATRIEANSYVYLRNHSITRQLYVDLIDYFEAKIAKGEKPEFTFEDFSYCISDRYKALR